MGNSTRSSLSFAVAALLLLASVMLALELRGTRVEPPAGAGSRFAVQSASTNGDVVPWALEVYGGSVAEGARLLGISDTTFGVDVTNPLVEIRADGDLAHPDNTTIVFGPVTVHVQDGLVVVDDVEAELEKLPDPVEEVSGAAEMVTGLLPEGPGDEPYLYLFMDPESQYAFLRLRNATGDGDVMFEIKGLVQAHWVNGAPLGATITNPLAAFSLGRFPAFPTVAQCTEIGCVYAEPEWVHVCPRDAGCVDVAHPGDVPVDSSLIPPDAEGHLLTVRAHDHARDGVDVRLLDGDVLNIRNSYLDGDPTTGTFVVRDLNGDVVLRARLTYPTAADATLHLELDGDAVEALGEERIGGGYDFDAVGFDVKLLGQTFSDAVAWGTLDLARGVILEKWEDANGDVDALTLSSLLSLDPIFEAKEDATGKVTMAINNGTALVHATGAELRERANQTQRDVDPLDDTVLQIVGSAPGAAAGLVLGTVEMALGALGCEELEPGCLTVEIGPLPSVPSQQELEATIGGAVGPVEGAIITHVNLVTGLVLTKVGEVAGSLPPVPPVPPVPGTPTDPNAVQEIAIGHLGQTHGVLVATLEQQGVTPVARVQLDGETLAEVRNGRITAFPAGAPIAGAPLFQVHDPQASVVRALGPMDAEGQLAGAAYAIRVEGSVTDAPIVLQPGLELRRVSTAGADRLLVLDQEGDTAFAYERRGDGSASLEIPALDVATSVPAGALVLHGNPVTDPAIRLAIASGAVPDGVPREITIEKGPLVDLTRDVRAPPGLPSLAYRLFDGPALNVSATDGAARIGSWDASAWLSGMRDVRVESNFESHAVEAWRVLLHGAAESNPLADDVPEAEFGYDGSGDGRQFYSGAIPASAFAGLPEGKPWWFALEVQQVAGGVRHATLHDNGGHYYRFLADTRAPTAFVTATAPATGLVAQVSWGSGGDAGSGLDAFHVHARDVTANGPWVDWIQGRPKDEGLAAQFTGLAGHAYAFRATACDAVDNCGPASAEAAVSLPASPDAPGNTAPTLDLEEPSTKVASGLFKIAWSARDAQSEPIVTVYLSPDGGKTFPIVLYAGTASEFSWDTSDVPDGADYVLKIVASDGSLEHAQTYGPFTVDNGKVEPVIEGEDADDDGPKKRKKGSPGFDATVGLAAAALVGLAFLRRRRLC